MNSMKVARMLSEGWERYQAKRIEEWKEGLRRSGRKQGKFDVSLKSFCDHRRFDYKTVSRWMSEGVKYRRKDTEALLKLLCEEWEIDFEDLLAPSPVVVIDTATVETIRDVIQKLAELQQALEKLLPLGKPPA